MPVTRGMLMGYSEESAERRDRNYDKGIYKDHQFNEKDFMIRRDLGLIAQELVWEEDVPSALIRSARNSPSPLMLYPASEVLIGVTTSDYVLYVPICNTLEQTAQSSPKLTKDSDPLDGHCCPG